MKKCVKHWKYHLLATIINCYYFLNTPTQTSGMTKDKLLNLLILNLLISKIDIKKLVWRVERA
jgi:hypothetical protein